jgi:hypothetical protein
MAETQQGLSDGSASEKPHHKLSPLMMAGIAAALIVLIIVVVGYLQLYVLTPKCSTAPTTGQVCAKNPNGDNMPIPTPVAGDRFLKKGKVYYFPQTAADAKCAGDTECPATMKCKGGLGGWLKSYGKCTASS